MRIILAWLAVLSCATALAQNRGLGTSATHDHNGRLWIATVQPAGEQAHVVVRSTHDGGETWTTPLNVNSKAEPVSADGENRPKIAAGTRGELYVTWTSPTSANFTGDIRFARSLDQGRTWSAPTTVHRNRDLITHRFESMVVDGKGRVWVAWIDKRDLHAAERAGREYAGAAVYYAWSDDQGASWNGDHRLADHTCECCRIALTLDDQGHPVALWRHVFANSERDHAFARLHPDPAQVRVQRATFDRWRIDACPHHGPSLTYTRDGVAHAVWFNQVEGNGRVFYAQLGESAPASVRPLPPGAQHADIAAAGDTLAIAWKRFDGERTRIETWLSRDAGRTFSDGPALISDVESDQPRVVSDGRRLTLVWRDANALHVRALTTESHAKTQPVTSAARATSNATITPFTRESLRSIEQQYRGQPFWLLLWDLECTYCMRSLRNLAQAQQRDPEIRVVTVATDPVAMTEQLSARLKELNVRATHYAFAADVPEALRHAIDPHWAGEKPRAYFYAADGSRTSISGVIAAERFLEK
jgi:hypothetical protein